MSNFDDEIFDIYMEETQQNIEAMSTDILKLEQETNNQELINNIFRAAHSIKGSAASMGFIKIRDITHKIEDYFGLLRDEKAVVSKTAIDTILFSINILEQLQCALTDTNIVVNEEEVLTRLENLVATKNTNNTAISENINTDKNIFDNPKLQNILLNEKLKALIESDNKYNFQYIRVKIDETSDSPEIRAFMVYNALAQIGEVISSNPTEEQLMSDIINGYYIDFIVNFPKESDEQTQLINSKVDEQISQILETSIITNINLTPELLETFEITKTKPQKESPSDSTKKESQPYVRVYTKTLNELMNEQGEFLLESNRIRLLLDKIKKNEIKQDKTILQLEEISSNLAKILQNQQNIIISTRMVSLNQTLQKFPRIVRTLASSLGKEVDLITEGENTELDRTVIDKINIPLQHLVRNAVDHGIELPHERIAHGKPAQGSIKIEVVQENSIVTISIIDDGKGIDVNAVKNKAVEKGLLTIEQASTITNEDTYALLFEPGFSTATVVTDISGRGVGMDVVKSDLSDINGVILIDSTVGKGTTFTIKIPLTLAISKALLCDISEDKYMILFNQIENIEEILRADIKKIVDKEHIVIRDTVYPLIFLREVLGYQKKNFDTEHVVLIKNNGKHIGIVIDSWDGEQDIVVKPLPQYFEGNVPYISGLTKLGDGSIPKIVDVNQIMDEFL